MRVTLSEAKAKLHDLAHRAERGETVVITYRGRDAVKLVRFQEKSMQEKRSAISRKRM